MQLIISKYTHLQTWTKVFNCGRVSSLALSVRFCSETSLHNGKEFGLDILPHRLLWCKKNHEQKPYLETIWKKQVLVHGKLIVIIQLLEVGKRSRWSHCFHYRYTWLRYPSSWSHHSQIRTKKTLSRYRKWESFTLVLILCNTVHLDLFLILISEILSGTQNHNFKHKGNK